MVEARFLLILHGLLVALRRDRHGVTAVEYVVIAALIIVVCIAAISTVGSQLMNVFNGIWAVLLTAR